MDRGDRAWENRTARHCRVRLRAKGGGESRDTGRKSARTCEILCLSNRRLLFVITGHGSLCRSFGKRSVELYRTVIDSQYFLGTASRLPSYLGRTQTTGNPMHTSYDILGAALVSAPIKPPLLITSFQEVSQYPSSLPAHR